MEENTYRTIEGPSTGEYRDRGSKFIAYAHPANTEEEAMSKVEEARHLHPKARHHCFAYRLGLDGSRYRANDDGEPSGTAGRPILGQIDSFGLTNVVVVVVRYFGGTLLGASGLIHAYKGSTAEALSQATLIEHQIEHLYALRTSYGLMGDVLSAIERLSIKMVGQHFGDQVEIQLAFKRGEVSRRLLELKARIAGVSLEEADTVDELPGIEMVFLEER